MIYKLRVLGHKIPTEMSHHNHIFLQTNRI